jgi:hypothetical protein
MFHVVAKDFMTLRELLTEGQVKVPIP